MRANNKDDLRRIARSVLDENDAEPSDSVCNGFANKMGEKLEENNVDYEIPNGGVFLSTDIMEHTWVVVNANSMSGNLEGIYLVDGTVQQFAESHSVFDEIAVLDREDPRWKRWYAQESESKYSVPNEGRDDISVP